MDDGELELSDHVLLPNSESSSSIQASVSVDSFLDELLRNCQTCTHTHTCNPPGPDAAHTHTCYHTHTQVIPSEKTDVPNDGKNSTPKPSRPSGNREAVRKYREKKKAHTAYLEEEVKKLRFVNQQLIRKAQRQAILETEILRLRGLLHDLRGKIDDKLGAFPFQKQCSSSATLKQGDCGIQYSGGAMGMRCEDDLPCFHPRVASSMQSDNVGGCDKRGVSWERNCITPFVECQINANGAENAEICGLDTVETLMSSASQAE